MQKKNKISRISSFVLSAVIAGLFGVTAYYDNKIPDSFYVESGNVLELSGYPAIKESETLNVFAASENLYPRTKEVSLSLFGIIPIKNVEVQCREAPTLIASGEAFGIKLLMDGVMVINLQSMEADGKKICPAKEAGIKKGDIIKYINNKPVTSNSEIQHIINESSGAETEIKLSRNGCEFTVMLSPVYSEENDRYFAGMWVRDSTAGIGTVTFIDKSTGCFAGLGHPVCDSDTGELIPISSGQAVQVEITDAIKGRTGNPGQLQGHFISAEPIGNLNLNNNCGVFGKLTESGADETSGREYKMAFKQEVKTGKAYILSTVSGSEPQEYEIEIEKIESNSGETTKNMIIHITDKELLEKTGGIVQGMSGSPIIQNGKLVGAVTHVFVDDSSSGYAIFAENMVSYLNR